MLGVQRHLTTSITYILHKKRKETYKSSATHLQCSLDCLQFGHQRIDEALENRLKLKTQNTIKEFIETKKFGTVNQHDLPAGKSGTAFFAGHDECDLSHNRGNCRPMQILLLL
jgi:hypothetical protein